MILFINKTAVIILITGLIIFAMLYANKKLTLWYRRYKLSRLPKEDLFKQMHLQTKGYTFYDVYELMHVKAREIIFNMTNNELIAYIENMSEELIEKTSNIDNRLFCQVTASIIERKLLNNDN